MVRIITDSSADFEPEELEHMNISCVPMSVTFDDTEYLENINLSKKMFYELLEQEKTHPRTSQPSPQSFMSMLQEAQDAGDEAVVITISSGLSGTCQTACLAKNLLEYEDCYVVDSLTATAGERILVEHAVKLRNAGKTACEIAKELEALRSRITLFACMDTLKYLYKGGRLSSTSYMIGAAANLKPILHVLSNGTLEIQAKMIGMRKGIQYLCQQLSKHKRDTDYPLYVMYSCYRRNGELLADSLRAGGVQIQNNQLVNVGAAIGTHIGPNSVGLVYVSEQGIS